MQSCYCAVLERVRQKASGSAKTERRSRYAKLLLRRPRTRSAKSKRLGKNREAEPLCKVVIAPSVAAARTLMQSLPAMAVAREEGVRG